MPFNPVLQSLGQVQAPPKDDWTKGLDIKSDWTSGLDTGTGPEPPKSARDDNARAVLESAFTSIPGLGGLLQKTGLTTKLANAVLEHPAAAGAITAGLATAPLTGGMSIPASMAFAGTMGAGGAAAGLLAHDALKSDRPGQIPSPADSAAQIGEQGAGAAIGQGIGAGIPAAAEKIAPWLMQKAVKPSAALLKEYGTTGQDLAKTLLNEGVSVTRAGLDKLNMLLDATNGEIRAAVQSSGATIDKPLVAARVLPTAARQAQQVNPTKALEDVGASVDEFMNHPTMPGPLTVPEAQAMKTGTYREIGKNYGQQSSATVETQKALARGLKEEIAAAVPQISALNARDSQLLAATDAVGRQVATAGNKDPGGFAWAAHAPLAFLAAVVERNPMSKSMLARGLWGMASKTTGIPENVLKSAMAALLSSGGQE